MKRFFTLYKIFISALLSHNRSRSFKFHISQSCIDFILKIIKLIAADILFIVAVRKPFYLAVHDNEMQFYNIFNII